MGITMTGSEPPTLALDPENEFVRDHLERTYQRKRDILREVSRLAELAG